MQFENVTMFHKNIIFIVSKFSVEIIFKACATLTWILIVLIPLLRKGLDLARLHFSPIIATVASCLFVSLSSPVLSSLGF